MLGSNSVKYLNSGGGGNLQNNSVFHFYDNERKVKSFMESGRYKEDDTEGFDVPFFDLESMLVATAYFSNANKLGQGGFGPVYKVISFIRYRSQPISAGFC